MPYHTLSLRSVVIACLIGTISVLAVVYLVFQARFLLLGPQITLDPTHPGRHNQPTVVLTGSAQNITRLWLNDRPIYTDRNGQYREALVLENGYTIATLTAEDRYGRRTELTREFVYTPATLIK